MNIFQITPFIIKYLLIQHQHPGQYRTQASNVLTLLPYNCSHFFHVNILTSQSNHKLFREQEILKSHMNIDISQHQLNSMCTNKGILKEVKTLHNRIEYWIRHVYIAKCGLDFCSFQKYVFSQIMLTYLRPRLKTCKLRVIIVSPLFLMKTAHEEGMVTAYLKHYHLK